MTKQQKLPTEWKEFVELLLLHKVEFIVVGAWALNLHAKPRFTADIDFFIRPSLENGNRLCKVLADFGFGALGVTAEALAIPDKRVVLGNEPTQIDLMTGISGLSFETAWQDRYIAQLAGSNVPFLSPVNIIINKESAGRAQDLADVSNLKKVLAKLAERKVEIDL